MFPDLSNPQSIERHAKLLLNKSLLQVVPDGYHKEIKSKAGHRGDLGNLVQKYMFGIEENSRQEPDFVETGIELKTTGLEPAAKSATALKAKERLKLGQISFEKIVGESFFQSSFYKKNNHLLLLAYLYEAEKEVYERIFYLANLWRFPKEDISVFRYDWERIQAKVRAGEAHLLSDGDTFYIGASTCGGGRELRQPNSSTLAKERCYSLKEPYLDYVLGQLFIKEGLLKYVSPAYQRVLKKSKSIRENDKADIEATIRKAFEPYLGMSITELEKKTKRSFNSPKHKSALITKAVLKLEETQIPEEFIKSGAQIKSITMNHKCNLAQHVSFPAFRFNELIQETWEESTWRRMVSSRFMFVIYQRDKLGIVRLVGVKFWSMNAVDLDTECYRVWKLAQRAIIDGKEDQLPRIVDSNVSHVRPHGDDGEDVDTTPDGQTWTKRGFWLNKQYIINELKLRAYC